MAHQASLDLLPEGRTLGQYEEAGIGEGLDDVRSQVLSLLTMLYPRHELVERRRENRYPFPYLVRLIPTDDDGEPCGESVVVVGKHLSERGIGFYHPRPIPHRRAIAALEAGNGQWVGFLVDLSWCRFTKQGWYESGGRLLQTALVPEER